MNSPADRARRGGARAAQRLYWRRGMGTDPRVDVFRLIEAEGVWLMFQPLGGLFGAYQREGDASGIIVNSRHPLALQRFTAGHELGHHILGHEGSIDTAKEIQTFDDSLTSESEAAAQAFASDLLMPLELLNGALRRMGLPIHPAQLNQGQVYQLSLHLGVSYNAMISRLVGANKLSVSAGRGLRRAKPIDIKTQWAGRRPRQSRKHVWRIEVTSHGQIMRPWVGDEVHILLPEIPSSGYVWSSEDTGLSEPAKLDIDDEGFETIVGETTLGGEGLHRFIVTPQASGEYVLRLVKRRSWMRTTQPAAAFEITLQVEGIPTGEEGVGLVTQQKNLLLAS